jgi:hypothetical protein
VLRIVYVTSYAAHCKRMSSENFDNLRLELRRGGLVVAVLAALHSEQYGYTLRKIMADHGIEIWKAKACLQAGGARSRSAISVFTSLRLRANKSWSSYSQSGEVWIPQ